MNAREVHLKISEIKIDNDNLDYIKMTGEICGKLRDDLVKLFVIPDVSVSFSAKEMEDFAAYMLIQHNSGNKLKTYEHLKEWLANER